MISTWGGDWGIPLFLETPSRFPDKFKLLPADFEINLFCCKFLSLVPLFFFDKIYIYIQVTFLVSGVFEISNVGNQRTKFFECSTAIVVKWQKVYFIIPRSVALRGIQGWQRGKSSDFYVYTHTIHVWYIYLHEWLIVMVNAGKYPIHRWYGIFEKCTNWKTLIITMRSMRFIGYIKDKHWILVLLWEYDRSY